MTVSKEFKNWLGDAQVGKDWLSFVLLNGGSISLYQPIEIGGDYVSGQVGDTRMAIPFSAIATVQTQ
jgi:hypothetical protein